MTSVFLEPPAPGRDNPRMLRYAALEQHGIPYRWMETGALEGALGGVRALAAKLRVKTPDLENTARLEAIAGSAQLEGNPLDIEDARAILAGEPLPAPFLGHDEHRLDILNHERALAFVDRRIESRRPVTIADLALIQKRVMAGLLPRGTLGRPRLVPIATYFIETGEKIGDCPEPEALAALLSELREWLNDAAHGDPCLRAIGFQCLAREVHPFIAGNRRAARIMQRLLLLESGEPELAALSSWEWVAASDDELRARLPRVVAESRASMTLEPFLLFVLESMRLGLERALSAAELSHFAEAAERRAQASREADALRSRVRKRDKERPAPAPRRDRQKDLD